MYISDTLKEALRDMLQESRRDINMYNYLNTEQEIKIVTMLGDDSYSIGDILKYIDIELGNMYKLGYEDGELHA